MLIQCMHCTTALLVLAKVAHMPCITQLIGFLSWAHTPLQCNTWSVFVNTQLDPVFCKSSGPIGMLHLFHCVISEHVSITTAEKVSKPKAQSVLLHSANIYVHTQHDV